METKQMLEVYCSKVHLNMILGEAFKIKCIDARPGGQPSRPGTQHFKILSQTAAFVCSTCVKGASQWIIAQRIRLLYNIIILPSSCPTLLGLLSNLLHEKNETKFCAFHWIITQMVISHIPTYSLALFLLFRAFHVPYNSELKQGFV